MALAGIVIGAAIILAGTVLHNSVAAGKPTGLSENGGLNFWMGQCDVHDVETETQPETSPSASATQSGRNWGGEAATTSRDPWYGTKGSSTSWDAVR